MKLSHCPRLLYGTAQLLSFGACHEHSIVSPVLQTKTNKQTKQKCTSIKHSNPMCYIDDMISSSSVSEIRPNDHEFDACLGAGKGTLRDKYICFYVYIPIKLIHLLLVFTCFFYRQYCLPRSFFKYYNLLKRSMIVSFSSFLTKQKIDFHLYFCPDQQYNGNRILVGILYCSCSFNVAYENCHLANQYFQAIVFVIFDYHYYPLRLID